MKKCSKCGKEEDFTGKPLCDNCATKEYCWLLSSDLIGELKSSKLKPREELEKIINKIKMKRKTLNEDFWNELFKCKTEEEENKLFKEKMDMIPK